MDYRGSSPAGQRSPCAVLTCDESQLTSGTITGMRIFLARLSSSGSDDLDQKQLLAALTLQQPNMTRVSNGRKLDGHLGTNEASLRLELFKDNDCSGEYSCELSALDEQGKEIISSNRLRQQRPQSDGLPAGGAVITPESSQLLVFVQQLALLENRLENRMRSIEDKMEDSRKSFEDKIEDSRESLEDKIEDRMKPIEDKIDGGRKSIADKVDKIEDKIESRVADKLCQLEVKLAALDVPGRLEAGDKHGDFDNFLDEQKETMETVLAISERIEQNVNDSHRSCLTETGLSPLLSEMTEAKRIMSTRFTSISELLVPKQCRRGMASSFSVTDFPYSVIRPDGDSGLHVPYLCDEVTDGGGWIVVQRRATGEEDFYRDWAAYKDGFGSLSGDFWIGNEILHTLTGSGKYELRVDLRYKGKSAYAKYSEFSIASEGNGYFLTVGGYRGTAGDSLDHHNGMKFTTLDRDNDIHASVNLAQRWTGAWWYKTGHVSNLNGKWGGSRYAGPSWNGFTDGYPSTFTEMKIRSKDAR